MKKLLIILSISLSGLACLSYPEQIAGEPPSCFDYRVCLYFMAKGVKKDCNTEFTKCCKDRDYTFCGDEKKRWPDTKAQECWDKRQ